MGIKKSSSTTSASPRLPGLNLPRPLSPGGKSKPSLSSLSVSSPLSAHDSLLRVARRSQDIPPSPGSSVAGLAASAASGGPTSSFRSSPLISPGEPDYDPLETPITPYPVQTLGVPAFRHEEFGWCANQDYRHTSAVSNNLMLSCLVSVDVWECCRKGCSRGTCARLLLELTTCPLRSWFVLLPFSTLRRRLSTMRRRSLLTTCSSPRTSGRCSCLAADLGLSSAELTFALHLCFRFPPSARSDLLFRSSSYLILISIGHLRDFFGKKFYPAYYKDLIPHDVSHTSQSPSTS